MRWFRRRPKCVVVKESKTTDFHFCKKPRSRKLHVGTVIECPECGNQWILDIIPDILGMERIWKRFYGD